MPRAVSATVLVSAALLTGCGGPPTDYSRVCDAMYEAQVSVMEEKGFGGPRERAHLVEALAYLDGAIGEVGESDERAGDLSTLGRAIEDYLKTGSQIAGLSMNDSYGRACQVGEYGS